MLSERSSKKSKRNRKWENFAEIDIWINKKFWENFFFLIARIANSKEFLDKIKKKIVLKVAGKSWINFQKKLRKLSKNFRENLEKFWENFEKISKKKN